MKYLIIAASVAGLCACSGQQANTSGNASANNTAAGNTANAATGNASAASAPAGGTAGAPAEAYRRYFDERWARGGAPVTPAEVTAMLQKQTPQQTVNALYGTGENSRWATVASGIAKGDPAWLALAPQIAKGTDAGTSDDFGMAAQDALTTNPAGTLRLLTQIEMGAGACGENGFEVSAEQARIYHQTAIAAVESVNDPALQQIKTECLAALRKDQAAYPAAAAEQAKQK
jgi:hypothetical protein